MRARTVVLGTVVATLSAMAACSLDLDEGKLTPPADAGVDGPVVVADTSTPIDAGPDTSTPPPPAACAKDTDCTSTDACLKGSCDLSRKACVFDACRPAACSASACDTTKHTCATPVPYKYHAGTFPVEGTIGCGGVIGHCFAVVYPFVFVGTPNGALAYTAADPAGTIGTQVPIVGLGFVPQQVLASGNRVFFLGPQTGTGGGARVPIAWADVPANPFASRVVTTTVLATLDRPAGDGLMLFARGNDTVLLVDTDPAKAYPSVAVEPPLTEPLSLTTAAVPFPAGANPVIVSGTRLIFRSVNATSFLPVLSFITGAGTTAASDTGDVTLSAAGVMALPDHFASSSNGAVAWTTAALDTADAGAVVRATRAYFVLADGISPFDASKGIDLEVYDPTAPAGPPAPGASVAGPVAMLDDDTAMVLAATAANQAQTSVQFIKRTPLALVLNADKTPRTAVLAVTVDKLAAAASNGIGYVLAAESATSTTVYSFDPGCAP